MTKFCGQEGGLMHRIAGIIIFCEEIILNLADSCTLGLQYFCLQNFATWMVYLGGICAAKQLHK